MATKRLGRAWQGTAALIMWTSELELCFEDECGCDLEFRSCARAIRVEKGEGESKGAGKERGQTG